MLWPKTPGGEGGDRTQSGPIGSLKRKTAIFRVTILSSLEGNGRWYLCWRVVCLIAFLSNLLSLLERERERKRERDGGDNVLGSRLIGK
jgi:hypothetical protein